MKRTHGPNSNHPEDCFGCKVLGVSFSADATPTRLPQVVDSNQQERNWSRDHAAVRRLAKEGVTVASIDGAANVEQVATTKWEAENLILS